MCCCIYLGLLSYGCLSSDGNGLELLLGPVDLVTVAVVLDLVAVASLLAGFADVDVDVDVGLGMMEI